MPSLLSVRAESFGLSQQPSTPVFAQLLFRRQREPAGGTVEPIDVRASSRLTGKAPLSFPLKAPPEPFPVPEVPEPSFRFPLPYPICQNATLTVPDPAGAGLKYARSAHWKIAKPPKSRQAAKLAGPPDTTATAASTASALKPLFIQNPPLLPRDLEM